MINYGQAAADPKQTVEQMLASVERQLKIFIYGFEGSYSGTSAVEYTYPDKGATHKAMLFLRQESADLDFDLAQEEIRRFGFEKIQSLRGNSLKVESMNDPKMAVFSKHYEEAIESGSSLVWYP